ncbi:hypothetical protein [Anabaena sp. UHCC 0204]|uniref:NACHT C-terminal alpha/beta 1 domain-containing protein n=1 Tax=Anabaena sp. UHCC 0204 TaxID=2590009 RepID=UPI001C2BF1A1|nr:hypothetical protein [Anabaena sp. UHCC 0204]
MFSFVKTVKQPICKAFIEFTFCHIPLNFSVHLLKLTDVLKIAFITEQPLDAPLKGFPPNQSNLLSAIQSWINEMG